MRSILAFLAEVSVSSGVIWAATMVLKRVLRKHLSPRAHLAVWLVLIARLMMPVTLETGLHFSWLPAATQTGVTALDATANEQNGEITAMAAAARTSNALPRAEQATTVQSVYTADDVDPQQAGLPTETASPLSFGAEPAELAVSIWLLGLLLGTALSLHGYDRLRRDVRCQLVPGADPLHRLFQECLEEAGIRRRVVLAVQNKLAGPALMYPNIVLVPDNMHEMSRETARMALRHELTHFVRRDHLKSLGLNALRIIWWFNPFVWIAVRTIREDIETACDADVVRPLGKSGRSTYANAVLSMYGRTETCQAVLGMAFGGAKKNAEKRIRGIYMKKKSSVCGRTAAFCLAGILSVACFTTACQPTPENEAVVNKLSGVPEEALIEPSASADPDAPRAAAAQYSVQEHWTETIDRAEDFKVTADADVLVPDVEAYPVEQLAPKEITQELADQMIDLFAPDAQFYRRDMGATREQLEERILSEREILASAEASGETAVADAAHSRIDNLTAQYESAPTKEEREPATTEFDYLRNADGVSSEGAGKNYIAICTDGEDGSLQDFLILRGSEEAPWESRGLKYTNAYYALESDDVANREMWSQTLDVNVQDDSLEHAQVLELIDELERRKGLFSQNTVDTQKAMAAAQSVLDQLGIQQVMVSKCEKALLAPYKGTVETMPADFVDGTNRGLTQPGLFLEYSRENGGIPCVQPDIQFFNENQSSSVYSAPFVPESISILIDQDYNVRYFWWDSPSEVVKLVAQNSKLIPLDEAKDRLVEELYRNALGLGPYLFEDGNYVDYDITELRLVMGYVSVEDESDDALAVPAWLMYAQGSPSSEPGLVPNQTIMVSALDGAPILLANSI